MTQSSLCVPYKPAFLCASGFNHKRLQFGLLPSGILVVIQYVICEVSDCYVHDIFLIYFIIFICGKNLLILEV